MAKLLITSEIVDSDTKVFLSWDGFESTSSDDIVKFLDSIAEDDDTIDLRINCPGGNVFEGWRIYDSLRQSGKKITAVVEGICASMATVILLAAPKDRRFAYQNATLLIHNPEVSYLHTGYPDRLTADEIEKISEKMRLQADSLREEQKKIVDLYVERTNATAEVLQEIMDSDVPMTIDKAIELGFITETLAPNTASASNNPIFNMKENVEIKKTLLDRILAKLGVAKVEDVKFNDLTFTAVTGEAFSVEREEGIYAVGDKATPDGKFVMEDGSTVTISDGVIASIDAPKAELKNPENGETISEDEAQNLLNNLNSKVKELEEELANATQKNADDDANIATISAKVEELTKSNGELTATIDELKKNEVTEEQKEILSIVDKEGGLSWLNALGSKQSNGAPSASGTEEPKQFGHAFLSDLAKNTRRFR